MDNLLAENRQAKFNYHWLETYEAGMVLTGAEVKAIKEGKINLKESYVKVDATAAYLINAHITEYSHISQKDYNPIRSRKLLLNKIELKNLKEQVEKKGLTIIATRIYLKKGKIKLGIALAKGKDNPDKKKDIIAKEKKLEADRAMKERR